MIESPFKTFTSGEALAEKRRVKISGSTVVYADAGETGIGVTEFAVLNDEDVTIRLDNAGGTMEMTAAGIIAAGAVFYAAADGKISTTQNGEQIGTAITAATDDGDIIEVMPKHVGTEASVDSARSRAATAMPTEAIWGNFNLVEMRRNPFAGSLLERDFTHGENEPSEQFADATGEVRCFPGDAGEGELTLYTNADNEAAEVQFPSCPITSSGGAPWALEARVNVSQILDTKAGWFIGLMAGETDLAGDLIADAGTLADVGSIGFQNKEGDGDILDAVYDKTGQTQNEHDDDWHTLVANTNFTIGLYYDGTTIALYKNGVESGDEISAADIAAADFPAADVLVPTLCMKGAGATPGVTISLDWIRVAQLAT